MKPQSCVLSLLVGVFVGAFGFVVVLFVELLKEDPAPTVTHVVPFQFGTRLTASEAWSEGTLINREETYPVSEKLKISSGDEIPRPTVGYVQCIFGKGAKDTDCVSVFIVQAGREVPQTPDYELMESRVKVAHWRALSVELAVVTAVCVDSDGRPFTEWKRSGCPAPYMIFSRENGYVYFADNLERGTENRATLSPISPFTLKKREGA